jgi:acylphosphatase
VGSPSVAWHNRSDGSVVVVVAGASTHSELGLFLVTIANGSIVVTERWRGLYGDPEPAWSCSTRPR